MLARVYCQIFGVVQGVSFRYQAYQRARETGIGGWIKNEPDGSVTVVAEGEKDKVQELINWLKQGPSWARISKVKVEWQKYKGEFEEFSIIYN